MTRVLALRAMDSPDADGAFDGLVMDVSRARHMRLLTIISPSSGLA